MMSNLPESPIKFDSGAPGVIESRCEFCGKTYWIDPAQLALAHESPHCPEFHALDVITFMVENRKRKEAKLEKMIGKA
jgi:hypothetical protein